MDSGYSYQNILRTSQRVNWRIEDIIGDDKRLDFTKPFIPEALANVGGLGFLSAEEKRLLNQIRGHEYLSMFGLVEEFILPYAVEHAAEQLSGDDFRVRALLQFAGEEAKHIHLFKQFRRDFDQGFGNKCEFIGPAEDVKKFVLSHSPLGVGIAVLHIEWITLRHYIDSVRDNQELDPQFKSLLQASLVGRVTAQQDRYIDRRGNGGPLPPTKRLTWHLRSTARSARFSTTASNSRPSSMSMPSNNATGRNAVQE